jgi:hypothetical protein
MKRKVFLLCSSICLLSINSSWAANINDTALVAPKDPVTRMKNWEHHVKLKNKSVFKDLKWYAVGPRFLGGRIESIAVQGISEC